MSEPGLQATHPFAQVYAGRDRCVSLLWCVVCFFSFSLAFLSSCLSQKAALRGTLVPPRTPPVPLIVTDLFFRVKKSSAHFLIHFAPLSSLQLLLRPLRLMKVNWPVPFLLYLQQIRALVGVFISFLIFIFLYFFLICCSLYRVCGCWANSCGSVLTEMFLL